MSIFKCKRCGEKYDVYDSLRRHASRIHKIKSIDFYVEYYLGGVYPECKCGCKEPPKFTGHGFLEWKRGHISRVHNNWGHNKLAIEHSSATRRTQFSRGNRKVWNDGVTKYDKTSYGEALSKLGKNISNNKERSKKISDALTGKPKSPEHIKKIQKNMKEYWSSPIHREEQSHRRLIWMKENDYTVTSALETTFASLLDMLHIKYERQWYCREIKAFYDFYIPNENILIETDGDFWHCNPTNFPIPKYDCQVSNLKIDKIKNAWAKKHKYNLLRFWESDIKNDPKSVIKTLLNEIKNITA